MNRTPYAIAALLLGFLGTPRAQAVSFTQAGTFTTDSQVNLYPFTLSTAQIVYFFTTSYGGGTNLDGTTSAAGGFVPSLTIFSVGSGLVVDCAAAGTTCSGMAMGATKVDPTTGIADDADLTENLTAGSYVVALAEFPNAAIGGINDGFLTSVDPTLFTDACGAGMFLEADTSSCAQRNGNFSLNIGSVPEPATFWLALPVLALGLIGRKLILSRS